MNKLFNLEQDNISLFVKETLNINESEVLDALRIAINNVPSISNIVCLYIEQLCKEKLLFKEAIYSIIFEQFGNHSEFISRRIYAECLGIKLNPHLVECVSHLFSEDLEQNKSNLISQFDKIPSQFEFIYSNKHFFEIFCCYTIIQNFYFDKNICRYRLSDFSEEFIIEAMLIEETSSDLAMIIELCNFEVFFSFLVNNLSRFHRRLEILTLIFTTFYHSQYILSNIYKVPTTSFQIFIDQYDTIFNLLSEKDVIDYIYQFGSPTDLGKFLGRDLNEEILPMISYQEFKDLNTENLFDFFKQFLLLTSISPTHFFSYLEFYKSRFNLTEIEQSEFINMLEKFYCNHKSILDILKVKLIKFGIINIIW